MPKLFHSLPTGLYSFLYDSLPHLVKNEPNHLYNLFGLVWVNYGSDKRYAHKLYNNCFSITGRLLNTYLGQQYLDLFNNSQLFGNILPYNYENKHTRGYSLSPLANTLITDFLYKDTHIEKHREMLKFVEVQNKGRKPKTIQTRDSNGNKAVCMLQINKSVRIDLASLKSLANLTTCASKRSLRIKQHALKLIHITDGSNKNKFGALEQCYIESGSGRLYGTNSHLQNTPKEVRRAALNGQTEYDLSNCHYSIFSQLAKRCGLSTPNIDYYLANKRHVRDSLLDELRLNARDVKECLIALIYGASVRPDAKQAIYDIVGQEKYRPLIEHELFKGLAEDIRRCKTKIIFSHKIRKGCRNVLGKTLNKQTNKGNTPNSNEKLAHLLQGYETAILHIAIRLFGDSITLLQHDGFTSTDANLDIELFTDTIRKELDLNMTVEKEYCKKYIIQNSQSSTDYAA